jgi:hypothetical protein
VIAKEWHICKDGTSAGTLSPQKQHIPAKTSLPQQWHLISAMTAHLRNDGISHLHKDVISAKTAHLQKRIISTKTAHPQKASSPQRGTSAKMSSLQMFICIQLGRWWVCLQVYHGGKQPFTFSIEWRSSGWLTSTHKWERWKQTTLLRVYWGVLLPCQRNVVCVCLTFSSLMVAENN